MEFSDGRLDLPKLTENLERRAIEEALKLSDGVISEAARSLNITRRMLRYKMDKLSIKTWRVEVGEASDEEVEAQPEIGQ